MVENRQALLDELARRRGLGEAYYDHAGTLRYFSSEARRAVLASMGLPVDDDARLQSALSKISASSSTGQTNGESCHQPGFLDSERAWGFSIQLYTLRSDRNWGIGDFGDLRELIELAAPLGCDIIGVNPLHALFPADPSHCSPYSPSTRTFLNVLYIDIEAVPEFEACKALQSLYSKASFQTALAELRHAGTVMYEQVATLKLCALRLLYADFLSTHIQNDAPRARLFRDFQAERGESLKRHALFDALDARFRETVGGGWRHWPEDFRRIDSPSVRDFAEENVTDIEFYAYLQWLADEQLASAQRHAREKGMRIGLYGDLAVGANPEGSEVWSNQRLYVTGASVGAPPDPLALNGQDWGIPPIDPYELQQANLIPFIDLIRANTRHVGALRIDHVMSLFRLWWVPRGFGATEGVYVHYPLDAFMSILVRESTNAQCLIIGEDLGTVPDEMRHAMEAHRLYHYKVVLFEKDGQRFKSPGEYVRPAVATATTHDLPLLKAWWTGEDMELRDRLRLYPTPETIHQLRAEREADRCALLRALRAADLWYWQDHDPLPEFSTALARAIHLFLGESQAALVLVQLEDLIGMTAPVNVPGTHTEHANWQRKLEVSTRDLFMREDVQETLEALSRARAGQDPNQKKTQ